MRRGDLVRSLLAWALLAGLGSRASADAIEPPPDDCPAGLRPVSSHAGPACVAEPPTDCPAGYVGRAAGDVPFCAPPHATACPRGSMEESAGPESHFCLLGARCDQRTECGAGFGCRPAGICIADSARADRDPRFADLRAYGECATDADCPAGKLCDTSPRCDPDVHRVDPEGRALPAIVRPLPTGSISWTWPAIGLAIAALAGGLAVYWARRRAPRA